MKCLKLELLGIQWALAGVPNFPASEPQLIKHMIYAENKHVYMTGKCFEIGKMNVRGFSMYNFLLRN